MIVIGFGECLKLRQIHRGRMLKRAFVQNFVSLELHLDSIKVIAKSGFRAIKKRCYCFAVIRSVRQEKQDQTVNFK